MKDILLIDQAGEMDYDDEATQPKGERSALELETLLTVREISYLLQVPRSYIYSLTHSKRIPHLKIGGHLRFRQSEIEEWLHTQEVHDVHLREAIQERT